MPTSDAIQCKPLEVVVSDRGIERAIKMLKRKLASEGVLRELKMRRHYMKPSIKRRKKLGAARTASIAGLTRCAFQLRHTACQRRGLRP